MKGLNYLWFIRFSETPANSVPFLSCKSSSPCLELYKKEIWSVLKLLLCIIKFKWKWMSRDLFAAHILPKVLIDYRDHVFCRIRIFKADLAAAFPYNGSVNDYKTMRYKTNANNIL